MNMIILYHVWQKSDEGWTLLGTTDSIDEAQGECVNSGGNKVYSFVECWYGTNG